MTENAGEFRMCRDEDVAGRSFEKCEALLEVIDRVWVRGAVSKFEIWRRDGIEAVGVDHVAAGAGFAGFPRPACTARRMSRR